MPRHLTLAQKSILDSVSDEIFDHEQLPEGVLDRAIKLNDYETVYQDIDRYLWDKCSKAKAQYGRYTNG